MLQPVAQTSRFGGPGDMFSGTFPFFTWLPAPFPCFFKQVLFLPSAVNSLLVFPAILTFGTTLLMAGTF